MKPSEEIVDAISQSCGEKKPPRLGSLDGLIERADGQMGLKLGPLKFRS